MFLRWLRTLFLATVAVALLAGAGLSYLGGELLSLESLLFILGLCAAVNYIAAGALDRTALTSRPRAPAEAAAAKSLWSAAGVMTLAGLATVYLVYAFSRAPEPLQQAEASAAAAVEPPRGEITVPVAVPPPEPEPAPEALPAQSEAPGLAVTRDAIPFSPEH